MIHQVVSIEQTLIFFIPKYRKIYTQIIADVSTEISEELFENDKTRQMRFCDNQIKGFKKIDMLWGIFHRFRHMVVRIHR